VALGLALPVFGDVGSAVRALQRQLEAAGVTVVGGADGMYGPATAAAVRTFQRRQGRDPGPLTVTDALRLELTPTPDQNVTPPSSMPLAVFPVVGYCGFIDTWHAPRGNGRLHEGTDIIAASGQPLVAAISGTVTVIRDKDTVLSGNAVRITGTDGYVFYAHLDRFAPGLRTGQRVTAGTRIGTVGQTGSASTPHLHFEIHPGVGAAVNPYPTLRRMDGCAHSPLERRIPQRPLD
jgi:murein DD-endopeptidase MepM/ murein hydrolase activator NlpD